MGHNDAQIIYERLLEICSIPKTWFLLFFHGSQSTVTYWWSRSSIACEWKWFWNSYRTAYLVRCEGMCKNWLRARGLHHEGLTIPSPSVAWSSTGDHNMKGKTDSNTQTPVPDIPCIGKFGGAHQGIQSVKTCPLPLIYHRVQDVEYIDRDNRIIQILHITHKY